MKKLFILFFLICFFSIGLAETWQPISGQWDIKDKLIEQTQISSSASKLKYVEETNICNFEMDLDFTATEGKFVSILIYFGTQDEFMKNGYLFFIEGDKIALGKYVDGAFVQKASGTTKHLATMDRQ